MTQTDTETAVASVRQQATDAVGTERGPADDRH